MKGFQDRELAPTFELAMPSCGFLPTLSAWTQRPVVRNLLVLHASPLKGPPPSAANSQEMSLRKMK